MSRILITYESYDPCNQTDTDLFLGLLSTCSHEHTFLHKKESDITKQDLISTDLLILIRPTSLCALELAKAARRAGIFLVSFFDDDLIHITKGPHYEHFHWRRGYAKRVLALSNLFLCENPLILKEYQPYAKHGRSIVLHPSVTNLEKKQTPVSDADKTLRVIYAAGPDHSRFFNALVGPAMHDLFLRYPDRVEFTFLGVIPDLSFFPRGAKIHLFPMVSFSEFTEFLKNGHFDIGIAPLSDMHFYNRKGVSKYIDYTLAGALGLYSNCMPYTMAIRQGENGLLVGNTPDDWLTAFAYCAEHPEELKRMARNAQNDLKENYSTATVAQSIKKSVPEFFETLSPRTKNVVLRKNPLAHLLFAWRRCWNEKVLLFLSEKRQNLSEQINSLGFFGAIAYYLKKPFRRKLRRREKERPLLERINPRTR